MLQIQHLALQFVGVDVDQSHLAGHALHDAAIKVGFFSVNLRHFAWGTYSVGAATYLGQDTEGTCHTDLADTDDGDLVARGGHRLGDFLHQLSFHRHFDWGFLEENFQDRYSTM